MLELGFFDIVVVIRVVDCRGGCGYGSGWTFWVDPRLDLELKVVLQVDLVRVVLGRSRTICFVVDSDNMLWGSGEKVLHTH